MTIRFLMGAFALASLAAGASDEAARFVRGQGSDQSGTWVLTPQQLAVVDTWLLGRKLDCLAGLGSPPIPSVHIHLVSSSGSELDLGFYSQPGYASAVESRRGKNLCHYRGTETEVAAFRSAIGQPK